MPAHRKLPSGYLLKRMADSGMTHQQIADEFGVGRSAVSVAMHREGHTNPVRYDDTLPWRVKVAHSGSIHQWMLRVAHRKQHGGKVSADEERRYESWLREMHEKDAVVAYFPNSELGFYWVPREPGDGELIRPPQEAAS
jgi:hypothetical protein